MEEEAGAQLFFDEAEVRGRRGHELQQGQSTAAGCFSGRACVLAQHRLSTTPPAATHCAHARPQPAVVPPQVLAGLPADQRAALLAAQAEEAMGLDEVDEVSRE